MTGLLLDTNILIALINETVSELPRRLREPLRQPAMSLAVSVVSPWEIAIKLSAGRLELLIERNDLGRWLAEAGVPILPMSIDHALDVAHPEPDTKDPFDRLLLAVCASEGMKLLTTDTKLAGHRLVY
jgi:PIN domain nuclease of toxin-antitoxin system